MPTMNPIIAAVHAVFAEAGSLSFLMSHIIAPAIGIQNERITSGTLNLSVGADPVGGGVGG